MTSPTTPQHFITVPAGRGTLAAFAAAIFVSAFLLFSIQPMFTKMVLPQLGGVVSRKWWKFEGGVISG